MKKDKYEDLSEKISDKIAEEFLKKEKDLAGRAPTVDENIDGILQKVGRKTTRKVLKKTCDDIVEKKSRKV